MAVSEIRFDNWPANCIRNPMSFTTVLGTAADRCPICRPNKHLGKGTTMNLLWWAFVALIISMVAGLLGFGGIAGAAAGVAKILFGVFLIAFLVILILAVAGWRAVT